MVARNWICYHSTHDYWAVANFATVEEYGVGHDAGLQAMMANTRPEEV